MKNELLEALNEVDNDTTAFLLETLENNCDDPAIWAPLLEPFLEETSHALRILASDPQAITRAKGSSEAANRFLLPTRIKAAETRAISLRQLRQVYGFIQDIADEAGFLPWTDTFEKSPTFGQILHLNEFNLYHAVHWIIKPATNTQECSLVEVIAEAPQNPTWFISHAWAEPIKDFLITVSKQAEVRGISEDAFWWVCAYANNQHKIETEISSNDPRETSFYRAMQQCEGVLLCLDETATPLRRIWCCFEEAMLVSKNEKRLLLDLATVVKGEGVVLTDGFVDSDFRDGDQYALEHKRDRETAFPLELLEQGYEIDIGTADAANQDDKRRILNTIAGDVPSNRLSQVEPNVDHPALHGVNRKLRAIFAEMATRKAAEAGRLQQVVQVLSQDTQRCKLTLNLGGCNKDGLVAISNLSGHPSLEDLTIDMNSSTCDNLLEVTQLMEGLPGLIRLHLSFAWSSRLTSAEGLEIGFMALKALKNLSLDFSGCTFDVQLPGIEYLKSLETLWIDFSYSQTSIIPGDGLATLNNLKQLSLLLSGCQNLVDDGSLTAIQRLEGLESLTLDLSRTRLVNFVPNTSNMRAISNLHMDFSVTATQFSALERCDYARLTSLTIVFRQCNELVDLNSHIWRQCRSLHQLTCDFSNCSRLRHCRGLATLEGLRSLARLQLNFSRCIRLEEVLTWLRRALSRRPQAEIDFTGCTKLDPNLQTQFHGLEEIEALGLWGSDVNMNSAKKNKFLFGDKVEYYSGYNQQWLPAVVSLVTPEFIKVEFEVSGKSWTSKPIRGTKSLRWPWTGRDLKISNDTIAKARTRAEEEKLENVGKWNSNELKQILTFRGLSVHKAFKNNQQTLRSWIRAREAKYKSGNG